MFMPGKKSWHLKFSLSFPNNSDMLRVQPQQWTDMKFCGFSLFEICIALILTGVLSLHLFHWQFNTFRHFRFLKIQGRDLVHQENVHEG